MKQTLKEMASISEMAKLLSSGDINRLLPAIVYNNPQDVNENLQSQGLVNYLMEPDELLEWFENQGNEMDMDSFYNTLDVPFDPNAQNITSNLESVIMYQMQLDQGANDSGDNIYGTWGEAFGDGIKKMYDKYFSTNVRIKPTDSSETITKPIVEAIAKPMNNDKMKQVLFIVGLVVIAVSLILISVSFITKK